MNRRSFLRKLPAAAAATGASISTVALASTAADFVAIPRETYDAIAAWRNAQRAAVRAANGYSAAVRGMAHEGTVTRAECDHAFEVHVAASQEVGPAREKMLFALLKEGR